VIVIISIQFNAAQSTKLFLIRKESRPSSGFGRWAGCRSPSHHNYHRRYLVHAQRETQESANRYLTAFPTTIPPSLYLTFLLFGVDMFTIEASEWADEGVELQPINDSLGVRIGNGAELLKFGYIIWRGEGDEEEKGYN